MADIRYRWAKGGESVGILEKLELPQFRLLGHRQKMKYVSLSTGKMKVHDFTKILA
jgi:glycine receptor alpha-3